MKITIMQKLFIVSALPIITLLIFSINYINNNFSILSKDKIELSHLKIIDKASNLIHTVQLERGLSISLIIDKKSSFFINKLEQQTKITDTALINFFKQIDSIDKINISSSTKKYIDNLKDSVVSISDIRKFVKKGTVSTNDIFNFYSTLNEELISIQDGFKLHTNSKKTNSDIIILNRVVKLQEHAGKERAIVSKLLTIHEVKRKDLREYYTFVTAQKNETKHINFLLRGSPFQDYLNNISSKYKNNFFNEVRVEFKNHEIKASLINKIYKIIGYGGIIHDIVKYNRSHNKTLLQNALKKREEFNKLIENYLSYTKKDTKEYQLTKELQAYFTNISLKQKNVEIDDMEILTKYRELEEYHKSINSEKWFNISTQRVNEIHSLEDKFINKIRKAIEHDIKINTNDLTMQMILTLSTILLLLTGTFYIAYKIRFAINQLENGIDNFFNFLTFQNEKPDKITTNSNDEINDMAQRINTQINIINENLEKDNDFINEITQIVMLMKDGDFSEQPYFKPHNPHLVELKVVFDELIELISSKIKEQTVSLERLNSSLEDRVYHQTIKLEEQIKDITIARDEAIQAEISKDEFLANMSHEIRTPLNAILGFVTILQKRIKDEKSTNYLNIIGTSGKSLLTIINDILDFSKIKSGKFTINPYPVEPLEEFSHATLLFASKAYEKHIMFAVYIDPKLPLSISIDIDRVKQILSNLLSNAIKFTPEDGEIKVSITLQNSTLSISVKDNGIGIPADMHNKVFSAFEQADGTTTRKYGGTGLGLSISSQLATLMKGSITLSSEIGKGSIFTLKIPVEVLNTTKREFLKESIASSYRFALLSTNSSLTKIKLIKKYLQSFGVVNIVELNEYQEDGYDILFFVPDDDYNEDIVNSTHQSIALLRSSHIKLANLDHIQALYAPFTPRSIMQAINDTNIELLTTQIPSQEKESNEMDTFQYKGHILIAEDNKTNQMLISLILDDYGLTYEITNDGLEAVIAFKQGSFDLVLMDENMPELNGIGAMHLIKEYEEGNALIKTPIIALTASVLDTDKAKFLAAGMDGFIGKPINVKELEAEFNKYLKRS